MWQKNNSELFRARDFFKANWKLDFLLIVFVLFFVSLYLLAISIYALGSSLGISLITTVLAFFSTSLALVSSTYATYHFIIEIAEKSLVDLNFKFVTKGVENEDEKVLLKALIKIKSKNKDIDLKRIYAMNKDLFTRSWQKNSVNSL